MSTTTMFIRNAGTKLKLWNPVITRGTLWVGIAVLTDFRHGVAELAKKLAGGGTVGQYEWMDIVVGSALAGFIALRLFLDQTLSRHVEEQKKLSETEFFRQQAQAGQQNKV